MSIDRASKSRRLALRLALACGLAWAQLAAAGPPDGRLDPQERERLRHDLRQQGEGGGGRGREERYRGPDAPAGDWAGRERGARSPYSRGGAPQDGQRERMTPEERQQLRTLLRERHRSSRN